MRLKFNALYCVAMTVAVLVWPFDKLLEYLERRLDAMAKEMEDHD